jgi:ABC-2 type transport system ATP-binding protein
MGLIECEGLSKKYRGKAAVDNFSAAVEEGEVFGLLGPNGAGKTTLFRLLLGLSRPHAGTIRVMGKPISSSSLMTTAIGAVVEEPAFYKWMDASRSLRVHARAVGVSLGQREIDSSLERVGLADVGKKPVKKYSQGMRQRLGLARAILHQPRLVILDEPANGLDPAGIVWLRQLLRELADSGTTVVVSSHQLGEIERVCDRVAIMNQGRLAHIGRVDEIGSDSAEVRVDVREQDVEKAGPILFGFGGEYRGENQFAVKGGDSRRVLYELVMKGILPESIYKEQASLEKRFLEITGGAN